MIVHFAARKGGIPKPPRRRLVNGMSLAVFDPVS
jgi:hypothetical protein